MLKHCKSPIYTIFIGMTTAEKIAFKTRLKQFGQEMIEQRIAVSRAAVANAQQAANSEDKSSAGDKYETSRAMGHLEKDMHSRQLAGAITELAALQAIPVNNVCSAATAGAVVHTNHGIFFISAGLGKQQPDGQAILFLSPKAPLAALLQHKKAGDSFLFNGKQTTILELY